jgi:hypothetical protein
MRVSLLQCSYVSLGSEMTQHEPVARIEAFYRIEWPGSASIRHLIKTCHIATLQLLVW